MNDFILLYVPTHSKEEAKRIAHHLLVKKLIACANIFPIRSLYWWEGKIADEEEFVVIVKTTETNSMPVENEVEKIHPYAIPCILKIPVSSNTRYFNWLKNEVEHSPR